MHQSVQLMAALAIACLLPAVEADIAPRVRPVEMCSKTCSAECTGGTQKCCPGGKAACSHDQCQPNEVELPSFRCEGFWEASTAKVRCCVPSCGGDADCPNGEVCRPGRGGSTCKRPTCHDLGGTCRSDRGCGPDEEERVFETRCESGCGYWRGTCGQACCIPKGIIREVGSAVAMGPVLGQGVPGAARPTYGDPGASVTWRFGELLCLAAVAGVVVVLYHRASPNDQAARQVPGLDAVSATNYE